MKPVNIILDAGHGGINPETNKYVTKPDKMHEFSDGLVINEGVVNRNICEKIYDKLDKYQILDVDYITSDWQDTPLSVRANMANHIHKQCNEKSILISVHCNWFHDEAANGIQSHCYGDNGYISEKGSKLGNIFIWNAEKKNCDLDIRKETPDSPVRPRNYAILRETLMPAILTENGFMSNRHDAEFLLSDSGQDQIANIHIATIKEVVDNGL